MQLIVIVLSILINLACSLVDLNLDKNERYIVLQVESLGFANRIRVIADMNLAALLCNRKLLISWKPSIDCNINISDIFEDLTDNVKVLPFILPSGDRGSELIHQLADRAQVSFFDIKHEGFVLPREPLFNNNIHIVYSNYNGVASVFGVPCEVYMYARSTFYSNIIYKSEIQDIVTQVTRKYFSSGVVVGVHYRDFDSTFDWNVVPPTGRDVCYCMHVFHICALIYVFIYEYSVLCLYIK